MKRNLSLSAGYSFAVLISLSLIFTLVGTAQSAKRWELLGHQEVNTRADHDRIDVGRHEGRFTELQVKVDGAPIEMRRMVVTFDNNETFTPRIRQRFDEHSTTRVIDLPGNRRAIKSIDFDYASLGNRRDRATVTVYGR
ncbi:MAG TPA: hypothetical protein VIB79_28235 [Candidatus Binatia bacterium]|jgi:hypothetical protein